MDCFAFISKTDVSSRRNSEVPKRRFMRPNRTSANNGSIPLGVIRFRLRSPPLLLVSQHAGASWLASAQDSDHGISSFLMKLDQSLSSCSFAFQKSSFRIGRPQLSCIPQNSNYLVTMFNIAVHLESGRVISYFSLIFLWE